MVHGLVHKKSINIDARSASPIQSAICATSLIGSSIMSIPLADETTPTLPRVVITAEESPDPRMLAPSSACEAKKRITDNDHEKCHTISVNTRGSNAAPADMESGKLTDNTDIQGTIGETSFIVDNETINNIPVHLNNGGKAAVKLHNDVLL